MKTQYRFLPYFIITAVLAITACFSPWKDDKGTIIVSLGGENSRKIVINEEDGEQYLKWGDDGAGYLVKKLLHVITITGADGQKYEERCIGAQSVFFIVSPGVWKIDVKAYDLSRMDEIPSDLYEIDIEENSDGVVWVAKSEDAEIDVKAGRNNTVKVTMVSPGGTNPVPNGEITVTLVLGQGGEYDGDEILYAEQDESGNYVVTLTVTVTPEKPLVSLADPTKEGSIFRGWYKTFNISNGTYSDKWEGTALDDGTTLYAKWADFKVTLHNVNIDEVEQGDLDDDLDIEYNANDKTCIIYGYGSEPITLPNPSRPSINTFGGWYDNAGFDGDPVTIASFTTELFARWQSTVTFDLNYDLSTPPEPVTFDIGAFPKEEIPSDLSRIGYIFKGWYDNSAGNDPQYDLNKNEFFSNITLYAKWEKKTYTLNLYIIPGQDGTWEEIKYGSVEITSPSVIQDSLDNGGKSATIPASTEVTITANGYEYGDTFYSFNFQNWLTTNDIARTDNIYEIETDDPSDKSKFTWKGLIQDFFSEDIDTLTLYAVFNGDGENTPLNITSVEELKNISDSPETREKKYALMTDLVFSNEAPICLDNSPFNGTFDGRGHTITLNDIVHSDTAFYAGLFGVVGSRGKVKNLRLTGYFNTETLSGQSGKANYYAGAVAGRNNGTIKNVVSDINFIMSDLDNRVYAGGIAGENLNTGTIENCYSAGQITGNSGDGLGAWAGGIAGNNEGSISFCWAGGNIESTQFAGGIAGYNQGSSAKIENCVALNTEVSRPGIILPGRIAGNNYDEATLYNNFAKHDMNVNSSPINESTSGYGSDDIHGANFVTPDVQDSWTSGGPGWTINSSGASESSPWVWDDSDKRRPRLWFELVQ